MKKQAKPDPNEPIVLSGRVYFKGFLAEIAGSPVPEKTAILRGDLRLHNVPKQGSRPRFGKTESFEGFYSGSVYDGKKWRRLLMRQHGAVDATYVGAIARRDKAAACKRHLESLRGKKVVWVEKESGFMATYRDNLNDPSAVVPAPSSVRRHTAAPVAAAPAVAPAAAPAPAPAPAPSPNPVAVADKAPVGSATPSSPSGKTYVKPPRRARRPKPRNSNQGELF